MNKKLKKVKIYGPDVHLIQIEEMRSVEKTYRERPLVVRCIGRILMWWESFIYSKLYDVQGIPRLISRPDPYTIRITYIEGENLRDAKTKPDAQYFASLKEIIAKIHDRGVVHLDLRNRRNYLIDAHGMPYIVDFGSCLYIPWPSFLLGMLSKIDWIGFLKIKHNFAPELITEQDQRLFSIGNLLSRLWVIGKVPKLLVKISEALKRFLSPR
jgi:serine/threonine protein kinase